MFRRVVLIALSTVLLLLTGAGVAFATCLVTPASTGGSASTPADPGKVPPNFPADLKQFVAGTDEFKSGPWFSGPCQSKGGDLGVYLSKMLSNESRLLYWGLPDEQKTKYLAESPGFMAMNRNNVDVAAAKIVKEGTEPDTGYLPTTFPAGDTDYHPATGVCAADLKSWTTPSDHVWGFDWTQAPDATSVSKMKAVPGAATVPGKAWDNPCAGGDLGVYCSHAFFVNCDQAQPGQGSGCQDWNVAVGKMYAGTANWVDATTSVGDRISDAIGKTVSSNPVFQAGKWVSWGLEGVAITAKQVIKTGKFIDNPASAADDWANSFKPNAIDFSTKVLTALTCTSSFDPSAPWFLKMYAVSVAIGWLVAAFMTVFTIMRSSTKGSPRELGEALFKYLPLSMFGSLYAPGFAWLITQFSHALADDMARLGGQPLGSLITHITELGTVTDSTLPGGSIMAIGMFVLMFIGAAAVWLGLMVHQYGMPLAAVAFGISSGMMVHPKYRAKSLRPVFLYLGMALSTPLLFFSLAVVFSAADAVLGNEADLPGGMGPVSKLFFVGVAMVLVGLAPFALLKYFPVLPTSSDSEDFGSGSPVSGEVIGGTGNALLYARGGGGGGGGGEAPPMREGGGHGQGSGGGPNSGGHGGEGGGTSANPMQRAYQDRSPSRAGGHSGSDPIGAGHMHSGHGAASGAAKAGGGAGVGAATAGMSVVAQATAAALTKAKSSAQDSAPRAEDGGN